MPGPIGNGNGGNVVPPTIPALPPSDGNNYKLTSFNGTMSWELDSPPLEPGCVAMLFSDGERIKWTNCGEEGQRPVVAANNQVVLSNI